MALITETVYNPETEEYETYTYDDGSNESVSGDYDTEESVSGSFTWGDAPGEENSDTKVDSKTGNITYTYEDGSSLTVGPTGEPVSSTESSDAKGNSVAYNRALAWTTKTFGSTAGKVLANMMNNPGASLITALAAAKAFSGADDTGGYNVPIPKMDAVTQQIEYNDPNRRPGSAGRQYTTDPRYVKEGDAAGLAAAQAASNAQKAGILAAYKPAPAPAANPYAGQTAMKYNTPATPAIAPPTENPVGLPAIPTSQQLMDPNYKINSTGMAGGGIVALAGGGVSDQQIKDWFAANQGASDTDIYSAMKQHKVGTDQLTKAMGFDPTEVSRRYDVQARADIFKPERSRSEQESMVNQFYQDKGLTPDQLGQTNFGYPVDTRESRSENRPFTNMYQDYQQDLANTGRYDAPAGSQFRAKAVYMPGSIGDRGSIKLIDSATGQELTNLGGANSIGNTRNAFDLMDKFAVDPASYRQAASQMYESMGKPEYMQDDYKYLTGYKPRDVAGATDAFLTKPLANATYADLKYNPEKDDKGKFSQDTRTNIDWLGSTQRLLMSKGMGASEATNYLHQLIPVSGLVDWAEISKSKDPVKAIIGTLNYFQSKKLTNRRFASGGLAALAKGRYLDGDTDGMADEISTTIDDDQEAALSHGEFVIPADVVSHLGNGNSDAGAKKLYQMMDRIREARTGTKEQGKKINPDKFMPGGLAASKYATGGSVQKFNTGGTPTASGGIPLDTSKTSTLSPWAGDYVTNMLGKTQALTNAPMQTYGGPLTAGASDLQQQGFAGISDIAKGGFNPTTFTSGTFDANAANKYMNPYLMASLNPQMEEARRQSQITQQGNAAKMTGAGAFGGSRSALMDAETQRSLGANMSNIVGTGLNTAYDKAMAQFNAEQNRGLDTQKATEASRQYSADFGLKSMNDLMQAGKTQRDIEAEGIAADKRQFDEQQARPYTNLEFQRKMLEGLPIGASTTSVNQDTLSKLQTDISGLAALYQKLANLGIKAPK